jgi:hypothetical protein
VQYSPLLVFHAACGITGIFSGAAALTFRKGSPRHALAGKIFVAAMLSMAVSAVALAIQRNQPNNISGGILTFYLITTAWLTARRKDGETSKLDWIALVIPLLAGLGGWIVGYQALHSPSGTKYGVPAGMHLFMGTVMLLAAAGDIRMLLAGGLYGAQRVVRHLWRMCFGLFIATGSFFVGGQAVKAFPSVFHDSPLLLIPALAPLAFLVFWFAKIRLSKSYRKKPLPTVANAT